MRNEYGGQGRNRTADASLFRAAGFSSRDCAPRECFARYGAQHRSPRAQQILQVGRFMVARDGIEPPTPAFSGLRSTD
ncbi:MAG: hypothetical protein JWM08_870 [Candidatus Angelobacter sp.]|nr:hypothetical protein [Candidatus Angelobacter sp.]